MKTYPSIPGPTDKTLNYGYYWFDKLDGSNIRAEWDARKGFHKFGTRRELLSPESPFYRAQEIIVNKYTNSFARACENAGIGAVTAYFEYFGPKSFAGQHYDDPEDMDVVLIDVNVYKRGLLPPGEFIERFGHLDTAKFLCVSAVTQTLRQRVHDSDLPGMTFEGVVGKALVGSKIKMVKLKSRKWLDRLRVECATEDEYELRS